MGIIGGDGDPKPDTKARSTLGRLLSAWNRRMIGNLRFFVTGKGHNRRYKVESLHGQHGQHGVTPEFEKNTFSIYRLNTVLDRATVQVTSAAGGIGTGSAPTLLDETLSEPTGTVAAVVVGAAPVGTLPVGSCQHCGKPNASCDCWAKDFVTDAMESAS